MRLTKYLFVVGMIVWSARLAHADPGAWDVSLAPGYALPMGDTSDSLKRSPSLDASAFYGVNDGLSVGLELGYIFGMKFEGTVPGDVLGDLDGDGRPDPIGFTSDIHASVLHITPEIKLGPTIEEPGVKIRPYVIGGGGWYRTHFQSGTLNLDGITSSGLHLVGTAQGESFTDSNAGFNIGVGIDVQVRDHLRLGIDARYHDIIYKDAVDTSFITPALRITWIF